jgi:hypothetical protein
MNDNKIAYFVPFVLLGIWFGAWGISKWIRQWRRSILLERSVRWNETEGCINDSRVVWAHVEISYEYESSSGRQAGTYKVSLPMVPFRGLAGAKLLNEKSKLVMAEFPPKRKVLVRYNPQNPVESVLIPTKLEAA